MPKLPANWIESTPEWKACFGLIDDEEYLQLTAGYERHISDEHREQLTASQRKRREREKAQKKAQPIASD